MPPAIPTGDNALTTIEAERAGANGQSENPRSVLVKDGLHVGADRPSQPPTDERSLLALVSSARHELRAPLQSIQGFAELLASESYGHLGSDQRVFVEHIIQGSSDLARALDACFELLQAEVLHLPAEPLCTPLRPLLEEALATARSGTHLTVDARLSGLPETVAVDVDLHDFSKAVTAIVTALAPLVRSSLVVSTQRRPASVEVTFSATPPADSSVFRPLHELPRRGLSARALLWLRLAGSLLTRTSGSLETTEGYDQVRIALPVRPEA